MLQRQDMALCSLTGGREGFISNRSVNVLWSNGMDYNLCFGLTEWIINWHIKLHGVFKWINTVDWQELWRLLPRGRTGNSLWKWWHVPGRTQEHCLQRLLLPFWSGKVYQHSSLSVTAMCWGCGRRSVQIRGLWPRESTLETWALNWRSCEEGRSQSQDKSSWRGRKEGQSWKRNHKHTKKKCH